MNSPGSLNVTAIHQTVPALKSVLSFDICDAERGSSVNRADTNFDHKLFKELIHLNYKEHFQLSLLVSTHEFCFISFLMENNVYRIST